MSTNIEKIAENTLTEMKSAGFDQAQVCVSISEMDELNITTNEASLLRSTEDYSVSLLGIIDGRKASAALTDFDQEAIRFNITDLFERAQLAPQDDANKLSTGQSGHFEQGPQNCDLDLLTRKVQELLDFRSSTTPKMSIDEGAASHTMSREQLLTSGGSALSCAVGCYSLSAFGTATEGELSSSFNYAGGVNNDISIAHAADLFGIGEMLRETERQIHTASIEQKFVGDVILAPSAVTDLLGWLLGQISDMALISNSSIFRDSVGKAIASPLLNISSRFDAPGHAAYSGDAFLTPAINLLTEGQLGMLLPSYYGSLKTGVKHTPVGSGWAIKAGDTPLKTLISEVDNGALVTRLSMGSPGANGDFSGVIKNSFVIKAGEIGHALSETMIAGNMAEMLKNINGVSKEHLDLGGEDLPWIRVPELHFS